MINLLFFVVSLLLSSKLCYADAMLTPDLPSRFEFMAGLDLKIAILEAEIKDGPYRKSEKKKLNSIKEMLTQANCDFAKIDAALKELRTQNFYTLGDSYYNYFRNTNSFSLDGCKLFAGLDKKGKLKVTAASKQTRALIETKDLIAKRQFPKALIQLYEAMETKQEIRPFYEGVQKIFVRRNQGEGKVALSGS